ncbi:MAG: PfkB family carbohydrate kinase [Rectinema sp.]|nr:PfkB family carbohydrate kinase [Rectinema sp.]
MEFVQEPFFLSVCLNPVIQKTLVFNSIERGEVNRTSQWRIDASGKGINVSRILTQCGEPTVHLTQLGGPTREWFLSMCRDDGLTVEWVDSGSPIRFCTTLIEANHGTATELVEEARPVADYASTLIVSRFRDLMVKARMVILSGTVAAGFKPGIMARFACLAAEAGIPFILDIKKQDLLDCLPYRPRCVKPNLEELAQTRDLPYAQVKEEKKARALVESAGREWFEQWGTYLVVTRGSLPTLYWNGNELRECPVSRVETRNPIGSGDAFCAGLARALAKGASIDEAVAEGTKLGALNASQLKPGSLA